MRNKALRIGLIGIIGLMGLIGKTEAQNGFNVPFSQFGLGSSELPFNLPIVSLQGGKVYTLAGNNFVNPFNPASYGAIETESFVFDMGPLYFFSSNGKYGYIDKSGREVIPCQWADVGSFSEGLAKVKDSSGKRWKIDKSGKVVSEA